MLALQGRIEELRREFTRLMNVASYEVSKCVARQPWNPNKIIELRDRLVGLAEELIREYERVGDTYGARHTRLSLDMFMSWYEMARRGKC